MCEYLCPHVPEGRLALIVRSQKEIKKPRNLVNRKYQILNTNPEFFSPFFPLEAVTDGFLVFLRLVRCIVMWSFFKYLITLMY